MSSSIPILIHLTTSINIRLTHASRTTVANTRFHKKGQAYQKSCQKMFSGFPIKSHPIQKKNHYIHEHPNKLHPNRGDKADCALIAVWDLENMMTFVFSGFSFILHVHVPIFGGLSGSEDRGGGENSIQFINFRRVGGKSFKEWRQKMGGGVEGWVTTIFRFFVLLY